MVWWTRIFSNTKRFIGSCIWVVIEYKRLQNKCGELYIVSETSFWKLTLIFQQAQYPFYHRNSSTHGHDFPAVSSRVCLLSGMSPLGYVSSLLCLLLGMSPLWYVSSLLCLLSAMSPLCYVSSGMFPLGYVSSRVCLLLGMSPLGYVSSRVCLLSGEVCYIKILTIVTLKTRCVIR